ncbi:LysE family translocator [Sinomonas gamaensis]|jgi:threonine/homoserine/homoserine lactone efflux protein|uniref:LysE family translocator n=1 Tax=Sinomonas gamaensis TaxID=2565624 RepID=UPI001109FD58|nr:LysE family translocator [Sinomonas gamaensis]
MVSIAAVVAFVPVAALIVAIPGPSVLFTIGRALSDGRRSALLTVLGNGVGLAVQSLVIAVGLGALLAAASWVLAVLKVAGGLYLVWLGVQSIRHRREWVEAVPGTRPPRHRAHLASGFVLGVTNPKTLVFLSALLPQFLDPGQPAPAQMAVLGVVFAVLAIAGDSVWAVAAGSAREWFGRSRRRVEAMRAAGGLALIGLGAYTLATGTEARGSG